MMPSNGPSKKVWYHALIHWLPFAVTIIIFSGLVYAAVQQNYRQNANDPQIQIAEDVVSAINKGQPADALLPQQGTTELASTLSPFLMVYSSSSTLVGSSILVDGKNPSFPTGVLDNAKAHGQTRVTWQPRQGIREAVVVMPFTGKQEGFVIVGRSLREVEIRIGQMLLMCEIACLIALVLTFILVLLSTNKFFLYTQVEKITEIEIKPEA